MQAGRNRYIVTVGRTLLLFILFHFTWLIFYFLSESYLLASKPILYFKQSFINSISFIAFFSGAFLLFPQFIIKRRFIWVIILVIVIALILGKIQFWVQDWYPQSGSVGKPITTPRPGVMMQATKLRQVIGSEVRAIFNIIVFTLFGIGYAYARDWLVKDRRTRELEKEKIQAELTLLRYQLNPHFLFNTINDIYYLSIIKSDKTPDALLKLSSLLRYILDAKEDWVLLEKELDYLNQFINLHKFRFPDEVIVLDVQIDANISQLHIAPLLLITFVENAFKHGEPGTKEKPVVIYISVEGRHLSYKVTNFISRSNSKPVPSGIGIPNLQRRLTLLCPNTHTLSLNTIDDVYIAQLQMDLNYDTSISN